jgi:hypothetical protein
MLNTLEAEVEFQPIIMAAVAAVVLLVMPETVVEEATATVATEFQALVELAAVVAVNNIAVNQIMVAVV